MRSWKTWVTVIVIVAIVAAGIYYLRGQITTGSTSATATPASFTQTLTVQRGNITASISPSGEVYSLRSASLSFNLPALTITELNVVAGQKVKAGDILAKVDASSLQRAVDQAEADLLTAQDELETARSGYTELDLLKAKLAVAQAEVSLAQAKQAKEDLLHPDLDKLQRAVRNAEYELSAAQLNLELTKRSTSVGKTVRDLEYTLAWYERYVRQLQNQRPGGGGSTATAASSSVAVAPAGLGGGRPGPEPLTLEQALEALVDTQNKLTVARLNASATLTNAQNKVAKAEKALADAKEALAEALAGPDDVAIAEADNAIAQAEAKLAKAQYDLQTMQAGPNPKKVELAQAKYDAANATLAQAQANLKAAVMTAPFDGTIISVNKKVGDTVSGSSIVLTMADLTQLRVRAFVDETKITQVKLDQTAQVTFDAFPGVTFRGKVVEVPVQGVLSQNVVVYHVSISLENPNKLSLKPGMTANIRLITGQKQNVLRVPAYAIQQTTEGPAVMVKDASGQGVLTPVQTGLTDGSYVEIVRGLNEGDAILAQYTQQTTQQTFPGLGSGVMMFQGPGPEPPR